MMKKDKFWSLIKIYKNLIWINESAYNLFQNNIDILQTWNYRCSIFIWLLLIKKFYTFFLNIKIVSNKEIFPYTLNSPEYATWSWEYPAYLAYHWRIYDESLDLATMSKKSDKIVNESHICEIIAKLSKRYSTSTRIVKEL